MQSYVCRWRHWSPQDTIRTPSWKMRIILALEGKEHEP